MVRRANPETSLYQAALDHFTAAGYKAWRINSGRRGGVAFGFKGHPDLTGYNRSNGKALFVECKRESERLTPEQWAFLNEAYPRCDVFVWTEKGQHLLSEVPERMKPTTTRKEK